MNSTAVGLSVLIGFVGIGVGAGINASIPDSDGTIHACYNTVNGGVRIIDPALGACKNNEAAISWSQGGQQGPPGPKGDQGEPGAPGAPGASLPTAIDTFNTTLVFLSPTQPVAPAASLSLPAGRYVLFAHVQVDAANADASLVSCALTADGSTWDVAGAPLGPTNLPEGRVTLGRVVTVTGGTPVELMCDRFPKPTGSERLLFGYISAIRVAP